MSAKIFLMGAGGAEAATIASHGNPDPAVVSEIEALLDAAKSGRVTGLAYVCTYGDASATGRYLGQLNRGSVGALFGVMARMTKEIDG